VAVGNPASALSPLRVACEWLAGARSPAEALAAASVADPMVCGAALAGSVPDGDGRRIVGAGAEERLAAALIETAPADAVAVGEPVLLRSVEGADGRSAAVLPLRAGSRDLGVLALVFAEERRFDEVEQLLLHALADEYGLWLLEERLRVGEQRLGREQARSDALRLARDQLAAVQTIIDENPTSLDEMLQAVLHAITSSLHTDYAVVLVANESRGTLQARATAGLEEEIAASIDVGVGQGFAGTIAATRRPWVVENVADINVVSPYLRERAHSIVGVPLVVEGILVGVLHTGTATSRRFDQGELTVLRLAAERIAPAIQRTRAYELQHHIASQLQQTLLPRRLPGITGVELAALFRAGGDGVDVGGDFYDIFPAGDDQWIIQLGDVCGHGPSAAAASALVRAAVRTLAHKGPPPAELLDGANHVLRLADEYDVFCTMLVACVDASAPGRVQLTVARAGHPPLLVIRHGLDELEVVEPDGPVLGVVEQPSYGESEVTLCPGDAALFYTDGLFERTPGISGEQGLHDLVTAWRDVPALGMIGRLETALGSKPSRDDIAVVALRVLPE
jgi:phosphoserine phosphatase RsbU/P